LGLFRLLAWSHFWCWEDVESASRFGRVPVGFCIKLVYWHFADYCDRLYRRYPVLRLRLYSSVSAGRCYHRGRLQLVVGRWRHCMPSLAIQSSSSPVHNYNNTRRTETMRRAVDTSAGDLIRCRSFRAPPPLDTPLQPIISHRSQSHVFVPLVASSRMMPHLHAAQRAQQCQGYQAEPLHRLGAHAGSETPTKR